jgi:hypothetical protein
MGVSMARVVVTLGRIEQEALVKLALSEVRTPRDQARYILRQELERRGLLPKETQARSASVGQAN